MEFGILIYLSDRSYKLQLIASKKYFEVATTPYLRTLTAHPTPFLGGTPSFFFLSK